jgi:hypothetical protein
LLALCCKRCSSLIDGIRLQDVPTPVTLLLSKSFPNGSVAGLGLAIRVTWTLMAILLALPAPA